MAGSVNRPFAAQDLTENARCLVTPRTAAEPEQRVPPLSRTGNLLADRGPTCKEQLNKACRGYP